MGYHPWRDADQMEELYINQNLSTTEIADRFGCGSTTVNRWLQKHGIERRSPGPINADAVRKGDGGDRDKTRELYQSGNSPPEIAIELERPTQTIRSWIEQMGIKREDVVCPTCGDGFSNENGMKVHHAKAHGESISGVQKTCDYCGDSYRGRRRLGTDLEHQFCSPSCHGSWLSENRSGEDHPNYSLITVDCANCGESVDKKPVHVENQDHNFCGMDCYAEWLTGRKDPDAWVEVKCDYCGDHFMKAKYQYEKFDNHLCGRDCLTEWAKENMSGEDSPRYKGGYDGFYGPSWPEQREKARERAGYACEICGDTREELGQIPDCHHIERFGDYGVENHEEANRLENLILMCRSCHQKWEHLPVQPERP